MVLILTLGSLTKYCSPTLPVCQAPHTYRPQVGFFGFVEVVIQGGKVVARFHFVALPSNHVGSTRALA